MLSVAAIVLLPLVSATAIFNVTYPGTGLYYDNNNVAHDSLQLTVHDPATGNKTTCSTGWRQGAAPATWQNCDSSTFSYKIDQFQELNVLGVEIKHQYTGKGKKCTHFNDAGCVTSRAYGMFNTATKGYNTACSSESSNCASNWEGFYSLSVFSSCKGGCGINSGAS